MQVVVFSIEKSYFAINTNVVQSINNTMKVTKVPKSSKFIKGLINIRGSIKTLVNINLILDVAENSPKENIMILSLKEEDIAIEVDFVKEVLEIEEKDVEVFKKGITLDDGYVCKEAKLEILNASDEGSEINLTIQEGKFHQVKRMFEAVDKKVVYLKRIEFGGLSLDEELEEGEYRELTEEELAQLKSF